MNSASLPCFTRRCLAIVGCLAAAASFAADGAAPTDDVATLKARLSRAEEKLDIVLRSYTLVTKENDQLKAQASLTATAHDEAVTDAASAKSRVQELQTSLDAVQKELATLRAAANTRDVENARLREILRQTQDTNAALAAENARLKTQAGVARPSPAGSYAPPAR